MCINIDNLKDEKLYRITTDADGPGYGERAVIDTYEARLYRYLYHPESKSIAPNGQRCRSHTRGLLRREHIVAGKHCRIGKEVDRRWEEGDNLEVARQRPIEYERTTSRVAEPTVRPSLYLSRLVRQIGIRKLMRQGFGRRILEKISGRKPLRASTLRDYEHRIEQYALTTRLRKPLRSR